MRILAIVLLLLSAGPNNAIAGGDAAAGQSSAIICIGCHGIDGNSSNPIYPKLAGQGEGYLAKQLADFKSGARTDDHMTSMVEAVGVADIDNIAAYFASQKRADGSADEAKAQRGKKIFHDGIENKGVTACAACHGPDGLGNPAARFPALAGQHTEYAAKALKDFRAGIRKNDPQEMMRNIAAGLSDEEIDALAAYIANLN